MISVTGSISLRMNTPWGLLFTGRNKVVAKVMFLHVCVILFTGGSPGRPPRDQADTPLDQADTPRPSRPPRTRQGHPPPHQAGRTLPDQAHTPPPDQADPPGPGRHPSPPDQADTPPPRTRQTPPTRQTAPLRGRKTAAYGQWAAGTHPTGMHSFFRFSFFLVKFNIKWKFGFYICKSMPLVLRGLTPLVLLVVRHSK